MEWKGNGTRGTIRKVKKRSAEWYGGNYIEKGMKLAT
jgi:hypothetical protein